MHTVFKNYDSSSISEQYPLSDNYFCQPVEGIRNNGDGTYSGYTLITWNKNLCEAKHMNEMTSKSAINFDTADEFIAWRDLFPIVYDENDEPIIENNILQKLIGWLAI